MFWFEWIFPIIGIIAVVIVLSMIFSSAYEINSICSTYTPKNYEFKSAYELAGEINCNYETIPSKSYDTCWISLEKTKNHGLQITEQLCPQTR